MSHFIVPFSVLEQVIKRGHCEDSPQVLEHYLKTCERYAERLNVSDANTLYRRVFDVLLETICDTNVAYHWRSMCLDHIYRPLQKLNRLIITEQDATDYFQLEQAVRTLSRRYLTQ
ncbi:hypothetical protein [Marinomonas mediterranea]|uniref:hypothetical protein n=1 Tax=Marinomonas mediterranea TaxID=119864 RepID=UPI00234A32E2|nr:hypothetical protein [Marinomonas mediterranea]WCN10559.1 hypothetical protein GV055_17330 [Marinomonas mediterranea]